MSTHPSTLDDVVFEHAPDRKPVACGLDLSMTHTGIAVTDRDGTIAVTSAKSTGHNTDSLARKAQRLDDLADLADRIVECVPAVDHVVIEAPSYGSPQGAVDLGGLRWLVLCALFNDGQRVSEVAPGTLKKYATGKGNADKDEVLAAVIRRYPAANVTNNNIADANVLAAMGARFEQYSVEAEMSSRGPVTRRSRLRGGLLDGHLVEPGLQLGSPGL